MDWKEKNSAFLSGSALKAISKLKINSASIFLSFILLANLAWAQTRNNIVENPNQDVRGPIELTVCSQNLGNYGSLADVSSRVKGMTPYSYQEKERSIVRRFIRAKCDVVAVQELIGKNEHVAGQALERLALLLRKKYSRDFDYISGRSNDPLLRQGFLVAKDRIEILGSANYSRIELPKLSKNQKPRYFSRGPFEVQLRVSGYEDADDKTVTIVNFHFKSKRGGRDDPAALQWETHRMEMSEALRRVVEKRHAQSFASGDTLLILAGDRNSHNDSASAKILEGVLALKPFRSGNQCRLSKRGVPLCKAGASYPQRLFSVLTTDPETRLLKGTYKFKKMYSWLDDLLVPSETLRYAWVSSTDEGNYDSGVLYEPIEASDHALVYARFNW